MPILAALRLLTIIPISSREATPDEMHRAPGYFPLVGPSSWRRTGAPGPAATSHSAP